MATTALTACVLVTAIEVAAAYGESNDTCEGDRRATPSRRIIGLVVLILTTI